MRERWDEASGVLERINPDDKQQELKQLRSNVAESAGTSWRELLRPGMRGALIAGVGLAIFQQFVGPNTVLFYTPTIFGYAGVTGNPLLPTIYVGAVLFVFVLPTIAFVDIVGRKMLFYLGLVGMGSMLVLLGLAFSSGVKSGRQVLDVLDLRHLRGAGHRVHRTLRARDQGPPAGEHRPVLDRGPPLAVIRRAAGPSRVKGDLGEG